MNLTLHELIKIFEIVIKYFNQQGIKEISFVAEDFYPVVPRKDLDFDKLGLLKCPHFGLGSLDFDFEIWKDMLRDKDAVYGMSSGAQISNLGGILTSFGQVSDKLDNPASIKNVISRKIKPPQLTINQLQKIFDLVIRALKINYYSEISFEDPRYIKIALKNEYLGLECPPYTTGSLDNCIKNWKEILSDRAEPSALAIERLGDLLAAFGEEMNK